VNTISDIPDDENLRISSVRLRAFKAAFKPGDVPLGWFNVVIGRNGSGKSTLLEALQWVDTTLRRDAREASDRTYGVLDLINQRTQARQPEFSIQTTFANEIGASVFYSISVGEESGVPVIRSEELWENLSKKKTKGWIRTLDQGVRAVRVKEIGAAQLSDKVTEIQFTENDRLALGLSALSGSTDAGLDLGQVNAFWSRAVFLRLSPNKLANGSPARRRSFESLLDEEGQNLPALLNELSAEQRESLVHNISEILPGIRGVDVIKGGDGRDSKVYYQLKEQMPYRGRAGKYLVPIPAWMLSEGTRRITAILALLERDPAPSLLCIEEIENGLDPWTVQKLLQHLQSASERGIQVVITTHSPWVLDQVPMDSILYVRRRDGDTEYLNFKALTDAQGFYENTPAGTRYTHLSGEVI
jgi:predicted ATPase